MWEKGEGLEKGEGIGKGEGLEVKGLLSCLNCFSIETKLYLNIAKFIISVVIHFNGRRFFVLSLFW